MHFAEVLAPNFGVQLVIGNYEFLLQLQAASVTSLNSVYVVSLCMPDKEALGVTRWSRGCGCAIEFSESCGHAGRFLLCF